MGKKITLCLALLSLLLVGGQAVAEIGTIDNVPAATLLLPYFEVNLDDPGALTTLFSINNASAAPAVAHVVFWTDLSVPTLDFDIYLTGYDVVTINLRDVFTTGTVPQTGPTVTPAGDFSLPNVNFPGCNFPIGNLPADYLTHIINAHTGNGSAFYGGACAAINHGDNVARGYITVDNVNSCSNSFPGDPGYFVAGGNGIASDINQLWGDYFYVDVTNAFAQGETLVHVEAAANTFAPGDYTFYGRYVGFDGSDDREPSATTWATRYLSGGAFSGGTDLICWRDAKQAVGPFACGGLPAPFPLAQTQIVVFDEDENPDIVEGSNFSPPPPTIGIIPCPWETTRVAVGGPAFPVPFNFGWIYLNLNTSTGSLVDPIAQSHVTVVMSADGLYSVGFDAIQLDNAWANPTDIVLPICDGDPDPAGC